MGLWLISTNYSEREWKKFSVCMIVFAALFVAPSVVFAQVILVPGFAAWLSLFTLFDNIVLNPSMASEDYAYNLVGLLNVTGAPLILMYLFWRVLKISYKNSVWLCRKLKLNPAMNLVFFNNGKKFYELKM